MIYELTCEYCRKHRRHKGWPFHCSCGMVYQSAGDGSMAIPCERCKEVYLVKSWPADCPNCGLKDQLPIWERGTTGLGDKVAHAIWRAFRMKKRVGCGCSHRQQRLNELGERFKQSLKPRNIKCTISAMAFWLHPAA